MNTLRSGSIAQTLLLTSSRLESISNQCIFGPMGLTLSSVKILNILHHKGPMLPTEILKIIGGTKSNITQRLNLLAKKGFVARFLPEDMADKRKVMVKLTRVGSTKVDKMVSIINRKSLDLASRFTAEEIKSYDHFMDKLNDIISEEEKRLNFKRSKICE